MYKKIFIFIVLGIGLFFASPVFANNNLVVEVWDESLNQFVPLDSNVLFKEANFLPGQDVTRLIKVTNNSGQPQRIATEAINYPKPIPDYDLSRALMIVIKEGATDLYGGSNPTTGPKSLYDFYQDSETYSEIYLSDLENGKTTQYDFTISFPSEKENEWQGASTSFDILIGFQGVAGGVPPGWGGGGVLPPGLTIKSEKGFNITTTTASFYWETSYDATSQVIYDTEPGKFDLNAGPSKYGYTFSKEWDDIYGLGKGTKHNVTLTGLTSGTTYYYRMVSHASLAITIEHSFTTLSIIGEEEEEEEEEIGPGEIIGEQEEEEEEEKLLGEPEMKEIGQDEQEKPGSNWFLAGIGDLFKLKNLWWLLLLLLILILFLYLISRKKRKKQE